MIKVMSKKLTRKALEMIRSLAEEDEEEDDEEGEDEAGEKKDEDTEKAEDKDADAEKKDDDEEEGEDKYATFWNEFGKNIKLGVIEDASNRNKLARLLRFKSTHEAGEITSLDEYISRMKEEQDTILYLTGDNEAAVLKSPILKKYRKEGYEVLILDDPIDEFAMQHLTEYEKRKIKSITKNDVNVLGKDDIAQKKLKKLKEIYKPLTDWWKEFLGKDVENVRVSDKLEEDPIFILTSNYGYSATMEKVNRA